MNANGEPHGGVNSEKIFVGEGQERAASEVLALQVFDQMYGEAGSLEPRDINYLSRVRGGIDEQKQLVAKTESTAACYRNILNFQQTNERKIQALLGSLDQIGNASDITSVRGQLQKLLKQITEEGEEAKAQMAAAEAREKFENSKRRLEETRQGKAILREKVKDVIGEDAQSADQLAKANMSNTSTPSLPEQYARMTRNLRDIAGEENFIIAGHEAAFINGNKRRQFEFSQAVDKLLASRTQGSSPHSQLP